MKVAVVGGGSWGTALASLTAASQDCMLWAREDEVVSSVNERHENTVFLSDIELSPGLRATTSLTEALAGADVVLMAVPSQHFRSVFEQAAPMLPEGAPVLSVGKGLERATLQRMTEIILEVGGQDPERVGVLTGPNLAREVATGQPAATVLALPDADWGVTLQQVFMTRTLRVYTNADVVGCEIAGAVKNVIAIAAGIAHGIGLGENTMAALITRGLAELTRLGVAVGGQPLTFLGLAGNGDLIATCSSPQSRNRHVGTELGRGRHLDEIVTEMHMVAEGVKTAPAVLALATRHGVQMPIVEQVVAVLDDEIRPLDALENLMTRAATHELHDIDPGI